MGGRNGSPRQLRTSQNNFTTRIAIPDPPRRARRDHGRNSSSSNHNNNTQSGHPGGLMEVGEADLVSPAEVEKQLDFAPELSVVRGICTLAKDYSFNGPRNPRPRMIIPRQCTQTTPISKRTPQKYARKEHRQDHTVSTRQLRQPTTSINSRRKLRSIGTIFYRKCQRIGSKGGQAGIRIWSLPAYLS